MTITQTVEIPASHRLTIDVPPEVPEGKVVLTFTPAKKRKLTPEEEIELINRNAECLNEEAEDVLLDQDLDAFEEDLKRATPEMLAVLSKATVTLSASDVVDRPTPKESGGT